MSKEITILFLCILLIGGSLTPTINSINTKAKTLDLHKTQNNSFDYNIHFTEMVTTQPNEVTIKANNTNGPLGEWPNFTPIGFITAPHPDNPGIQTHLYGDWGGIVGEEFIFLQDYKIKLLYHSYHETYMTERTHEYNFLDNWALGYDPVTKIKLTPLAKPGGPNPGPAHLHTDTPSYIHHPTTGDHLLYNSVRPGTKDDHPEWVGIPGTESSIQVATSTTPPSMGTPFTQTYDNILTAEYWWEKGWNQNGEIKGGLSEPTPVWVPHLGKIRLFYRGLNGAVGTYWTWRISYADSIDGKTNWTKKGIATFDPSVPGNPAYDIWQQTGFRGAWQAHVTGDSRANGVHMILTVSNQNYAGGGRISYFWSPDWGDTWIAHPMNPIIIPGAHPDGVPATGFQRTPTLLIDEEYNRYVLAYNAGHDINQKWKRRTYIATASRPIEGILFHTGWNLVTVPVQSNFSASSLLSYIPGSVMVSGFDAFNQTYKSYVTGDPPPYDFPIEDGYGYFVYMSQDNTGQFTGDAITSVLVTLYAGYNMIGWYQSYNTTASSLLSAIPGALIVSVFDSVNQTYKSYATGDPPIYDFTISTGMGIFVWTDQASTWNGTD